MGQYLLQGSIFTAVAIGLAKWLPKVLEGKRDFVNKKNWMSAAILLFSIAFITRIVIGLSAEGYGPDISTFKYWGGAIRDVGFKNAYGAGFFLDYPPGYLYVLTALDGIREFFNIPTESEVYTLMIKLPAILADMVSGAAIFYLAKKEVGEKYALFFSAAYLFCPAVILNSVVWGQIDSFCTLILAAAVYLLYKGRYMPACLVFGVSIICKPQMLVFAPVFIFMAIREKRWRMLLIGPMLVVGSIVIMAKPFTEGWNFMWLINQYQETMNGYEYLTVNAYNIFLIFNQNWGAMPETGFLRAFSTALGPIIATALCGYMMLKSKSKKIVFPACAVLMTSVFLITIKMHERYLFPAMFFMLIACIFTEDFRLWLCYVGISVAHYFNVSHVLHIFNIDKPFDDMNSWIGKTVAWVTLAATIYFLYVLYKVYVLGETYEETQKLKNRQQGKQANMQKKNNGKNTQKLQKKKGHHVFSVAERFKDLFTCKEGRDSRIKRIDVILVAGISLIYGIIAFWDLGDMQTAVTPWTPKEGAAVVLEASEPADELYYITGIAPDEDHYDARISSHVKVEISEDGENWNLSETELQKEAAVFCWEILVLPQEAKFIRLTPLDNEVCLNEVGAKKMGAQEFLKLSLVSGDGAMLLDEQEVVPLHPSYKNSTYFDEIYHARTAYEHLLLLEPYESTHPPFGKLLMSIGIMIFGMNPFGWRFIGVVFGILMLPAIYHLIKQLFGSTFYATIGMLLFTFDFMHYTQTRLATIDTYAVFFIILMYDAMVVFIKKDLLNTSLGDLLFPLALSGVFMGIGSASKWTVLYGAVGLAILLFTKFGVAYASLKAPRDKDIVLQKIWNICLACFLLFIIIPFAIYFMAFLPMTTLPHNNTISSFFNYQKGMYDYHSTLEAEHGFASPWYEWPLNIRPIWYYIKDVAGAPEKVSTISAMGNPALWWTGIPAMIGTVVILIKKKTLPALVFFIGFLSVYMPWVLVSRISFIYHYFTAIPFLIVAILCMAEYFEDRPVMQKGFTIAKYQVTTMQIVLCAFTVLCIGLFIAFFPVISGAVASREYIQSLKWLPNWFFA